eukprot:TRINITY_DN22867_c0_g1_i1.p1 TRINITY_DN22867_c0_g1~~TRINITY_DN22867_c0_g1_i1.p1  ORF type:complete len:928 (-),score=125.82 TRINITY_DN22867_c0_g1_i1:144-2927(-)
MQPLAALLRRSLESASAFVEAPPGAHDSCTACALGWAFDHLRCGDHGAGVTSTSKCLSCGRTFCKHHLDAVELTPGLLPQESGVLHLACQECSPRLQLLMERDVTRVRLARIASAQMRRQVWVAPKAADGGCKYLAARVERERCRQCVDCGAGVADNCAMCGLALCQHHLAWQPRVAGPRAPRDSPTCRFCEKLAIANAAARSAVRAAVAASFRGSLVTLAMAACSPSLEDAEDCAACGLRFSLALGSRRQHCGACGQSLCAACFCGHAACLATPMCPHAAELPWNNYASKEPVCQSCLPAARARLAARKVVHLAGTCAALYVEHRIRAEAFLVNPKQLSMYGQTFKDDAGSKAIRAASFVLEGAKQALPLLMGPVSVPWQAATGLQFADYVWRLGGFGLVGVMLRGEISKTISVLLSLTAALPKLTARDILVGGVYLSADHRKALRDRPERRQVLRRGCEAVPSPTLHTLMELAVLALELPYQANPFDAQRFAHQQGWRLVSHRLGDRAVNPENPDEMWKRRPAWCLLMRYGEHRRCEAVVSIRGTDVEQSRGGDLLANLDASPETHFSADGGPPLIAHRGMLRAAKVLLTELGPVFQELASSGCFVTLMGHSLGAGLAALLLWLLLHGSASGRRQWTIDGSRGSNDCAGLRLRGVGYCVPCIMDQRSAEGLRPYFTAVVNSMDVVSRLTVGALAQLGDELVACAASSGVELEQDTWDVLERICSMWAPRLRSETCDHGPDAGVVYGHHTLATLAATLGATLTYAAHDAPSYELYVPGEVIWIYRDHGYLDAAVVPCDLPALRRIVVDKRMITDHSEVFEALRAVHARRAAGAKGDACRVRWQPFEKASESCLRCGNDYAWMCAGSSRKQRWTSMTNCRVCGMVVCMGCAGTRWASPSPGVPGLARVCDSCAWKAPPVPQTCVVAS